MDPETSTYIDSIVDRRVIVAFDLFGTLLSTESTSKKLAEYYGDKAELISATWRKYQLEYTWRLNSMGNYESFDLVTKKSLHHALSEASVTHDESTIDSIIASYASLSPFDDVEACLSAISSVNHIQLTIFTNGTSQMVSDALANTSELELFTTIHDSHVSADEIEKYKPHPMVYEYLAAKMGKSLDIEDKYGGMNEVVLVTANPFDVVGAQAVGIVGDWVDRNGSEWKDALVDEGPKVTIKSLGELKGVLDGIVKERTKVWDEAEGKK